LLITLLTQSLGIKRTCELQHNRSRLCVGVGFGRAIILALPLL
jgi:hypothetical protein